MTTYGLVGAILSTLVLRSEQVQLRTRMFLLLLPTFLHSIMNLEIVSLIMAGGPANPVGAMHLRSKCVWFLVILLDTKPLQSINITDVNINQNKILPVSSIISCHFCSFVTYEYYKILILQIFKSTKLNFTSSNRYFAN